MKTILVPIDFSENAERALSAAKLFASGIGARLVIFHSYQPYVPDMTVPVGVESLPVYEDIERSMKAQLDTFVKVAESEGFVAEGIWEIGSTHSTVIKKAKELNADMIVIGRTGKGGFIDKLIGSSATGIAMDAPCPVLVVPPQAEIKGFKEVVYATQLEYDENDVLQEVIALGQTMGFRLSLVKIDALEQPNIQEDKQFVEEIVSALPLEEKDIVIRQAGSVRSGIEEYCDEVKANLLVVSARHRGFLEELIISPSIAKKLVLHTHVPLLVYHLKSK